MLFNYFFQKNYLPRRFYANATNNPKIFNSVAEAVRDIPSGATLLVGGLLLVFSILIIC